jgi:heme oxygenase (biliverdin-IX-beta and delta-forming)
MLMASLPTDVSLAEKGASGLREKLKQSTAAAHRQLDGTFSGFDLTSASGYRRFLEASAAALLPLEAALERAGVETILPDWPERVRSKAIAADLAVLGGQARPLCAVKPLSRNAVLGATYVLEGSRLGAKYLMRAIAEHGDPLILAATNYLGHGAGQPLWRTFLARLESEPVTPADEAEVIRGAHHAFAMFSEAAALA